MTGRRLSGDNAQWAKIDKNKQIKRESLLETAFNLFTSKGIHKTSISDIVDNAGVAKGTFYLYFQDKYDIRNKLIAHKSGEVSAGQISPSRRRTLQI